MTDSTMPTLPFDDWEVSKPIASKNSKVTRKRKSSTAVDLTQSVTRYRFSGNDDAAWTLMMGGPIYDAISRSDDTFMELLLECMSERQLRTQVARVSTEWCGLAYKVLRRRIGNRVFTLLYSVRSYANDISLSQFFHPSILCRKTSGVLDGMESPNYMNDNRTASNDKPVGHLDRLPQPAEVQGIIGFGNENMEEELLSCHEEPHVEVFVYIISQAIFFTSPDLKEVGNSINGFRKPKLGDLDTLRGGRVLSTLLFPQSQHFALDIFTLAFGNEKWSLEEKYGRKMFHPSFVSKAMLVFQMYEDLDVDRWVNGTLIKAFERGSTVVSVISSVYTFVGTSLIKPNTAVSAVCIAFMGDFSTSVISVAIDLGQRCPELLEVKFTEMSFFINENITVSAGMSIFALMFCYFENGMSPESSDVLDSINNIMQKFVARFPSVPIQAISSVAEVRHQQAARAEDMDLMSLDLSMKRLTTRNCKSDSYRKMMTQKAVILLVKYPLDFKSRTV